MRRLWFKNTEVGIECPVWYAVLVGPPLACLILLFVALGIYEDR